MLDRLRKSLSTAWFNYSVRAVRQAQPCEAIPGAGICLVTQIYPPDLHMYLLAIKSFLRFVPAGEIHVVADRLTAAHKKLLQEQVRGIHIVDIDQVDTDGFPSGGCWERLLHIVDLSQRAYVVQLDADTLTFVSPSEVLQCIQQGVCFTLGTGLGQMIVAAEDMSALLESKRVGARHVQVVAELAFRSMQIPRARYVRGNAAFAGFAKESVSRSSIKQFSDEMVRLIGREKWSEWGSEQVSSNFAVANTNNATVLPIDRYRYFDPEADMSTATLVHFIGSARFKKGVYRRSAVKMLSSFNDGGFVRGRK